MSREDQVIQAIQYLWDEGFIVAGCRDGEPTLFLTTTVDKVHSIIQQKTIKQDNADWWKK